MKKQINQHKLLAFASVLTIFGLSTGCNLSEVNVNPNASNNAPISTVLSGAEGTLAFSQGVDAGIQTGITIQQFAGSNGDAVAFDNYNVNTTYYNSIWGSFYTNGLKNLNIVYTKSKELNSPYYTGISRILSAYTFSTLSDIFGDIPYKQALHAEINASPAIDKQQDIYADLQKQLDSAITELSLPANSFTAPAPGADDLFFRGNTQNWLAAAWTLKARLAIHLSKVDANTAAQTALNYLYDANGNYRGITSNANDLQIVFGAAVSNSNPFYQQNTNRPGWVGLGASFVNLLNGNAIDDPSTKPETAPVDPRRSVFATQYPAASGKYRGSVAGVPGAFSVIGSYYASSTSPVVFLSYVEAKFIEAEARLILNDRTNAEKALKDATLASINKIANPADPNASQANRDAYLAAKTTLTGDLQSDLKTIITQKYIALFTQAEVWTDYRRTGYPALKPSVNGTNTNNPDGLIPRRFPYPQSEQVLNTNIQPANYQTPRLYWDK
ncbi:SusD/RagB family nutrient-binding outer membrane lipoprotein [Solitalea sp. MAHUQ-68]|uniref:SusD/RagB family nutrient-binding outer membrane lipoprotein n=1 Tax=Solitalea agri TaxID=2953739 RepID=A0A9X2F0P7_9SPHI|nr:SusD/RagB family nutrient-binding outer membrane lipoprotein [Solitalea agri]MCO4292547.1 SusD/RagB family nutrient-binding outer membrane lipoprotein [Solitalea agri]